MGVAMLVGITATVLNGCGEKETAKYYERKNAMVESPQAEHEKGISTNDNDKIKITVPADGKYLILAKGTYEGLAYCIVDAVLYVYNVGTNQPLCEQKIKENYNLVRHPELNPSIRVSKEPRSQEVTGTLKFITLERLKKGDELELRFGNINHSDGATVDQRRFKYAAPGDFLVLMKLPD